MAKKRFLVGVGEVRAFQGQNLVFVGKTMLETGIEVTTSSTEIRGGTGNPLQAIYYHTSAFNVTITDTQFSLPLIALNTGATISAGGDVWTQETVTINGGKGAIVGTPVSMDGGDPSVWTEYNGTYYTFPMDTGAQTFTATGIPNGTTICVMYLNTVNAAQKITIPANIIPERVRVYITSNLSGDTTGSGFLGTATIEVPILQLSGASTITMTADGYSNTPLTGMAIAYTDDTTTGCSVGSYYATITEDLFDTNWYDNATALAIEGGDFELGASGATKQLQVWYVANGRSYIAPLNDLTFAVSSGNSATVGNTVGTKGLVTSTATDGDTLISVKITSKTTIEASCTVTVSGN